MTQPPFELDQATLNASIALILANAKGAPDPDKRGPAVADLAAAMVARWGDKLPIQDVLPDA